MFNMKKILLGLSAFLALAILSPSAQAAGGETQHAPEQEWHFDGPFGTYDRAALQRGYKVYREVCAACHAMKRVSFRNLEAIGYNENQVKAIASEYTVTDGPNDDGDMFERPGRPSDPFPSPFANDKAAAAANGAVPPDLSLITKARHGGADYIYGLLTGYEAPPEGHELHEGQYYNKYMPGHIIAMAPPLSDGQVAYEDETPATLPQYAKDVAEFLTWAAEPEMEERKRKGINVLFYLAIFAGIMYAYKKKIWANVKH
jgi:ubiquinol-cytochrome c reductase cytochrome c1 subunit